jgi:outer membrane protein TolC
VQQAINTAGREAIAVRAGRHSRDAAVQDTAAIRQAVVLEATAAYYRYALALRVVEVEQEALVKAEQYLAFAEASVAAGKQAKYAQTRAAVSAAEARLSLLDAHNAARSARLELDIAAGVSLGDSVVLTDSLETAPEAAALERALVSARDNNPSYAAARAREESARLLLRSARAAFAPRVTASAQVGQSAANGGDFDADWGADLGVSVPLFAGGALRAAVEQARASHAQAVAGLRAAEQQLQADVERAVLAQQAAAQAVEAAAALVAQSREGLELAEERNRAGVGIPLEIADARAAYAAAAMKHAQTLFALQLAHASLLMAMGQLGG